MVESNNAVQDNHSEHPYHNTYNTLMQNVQAEWDNWNFQAISNVIYKMYNLLCLYSKFWVSTKFISSGNIKLSISIYIYI